MFNSIAVILPSTGQTPGQQLPKEERKKYSGELKVEGEGNKASVCMAFAGYCKHCQHLS